MTPSPGRGISRRILLALVPIIFLGVLLLSRREAPSHRPSSVSAPSPEAASSVPLARSTSGVISSDAGGKVRSHAELIVAARMRIHHRLRRGGLNWLHQSMHLHAPLPQDPTFWGMVEDLKKDLGPDAPAVLADLIEEAAAERTQELYVSLLAGLKDPAAESRLAELATSSTKELVTRSLALYGLGLLKTDSAWKVALEVWKRELPDTRGNLFPGIGLFGERAVPLLLQEAKESKSQFGYIALGAIQAPEASARLWELVETAENKDIRDAALRAAARNPDPATVSRLFDILANPERQLGGRVDVTGPLRELFTYGGFSLGSDPRLLERVMSQWNDLPLDVRWALWSDAAVRRSRPDGVDGLALPEKMKWTFAWSSANDPAKHGQLAEYAAAHPDDMALHFSLDALKRLGGFSDPALAGVARQFALTPPTADEEGGRRYWGWQVLSVAPSEERARALADFSDLYGKTAGQEARLKWAAGLSLAGPDAGPVAIQLLRKETDPLVRLELIATAASTSGTEADLRAVASAEIDQILSGATETGIRFAAAHPWGNDDGLDRYASLVRDIFGAFGTPDQIPKLREYFSGLVLPASFRTGTNASRSDEDYRETLQWTALEGIDAIRARN